jgi:hypothetical protein
VAILSFGDVSQRAVWIDDRRIDELCGARPRAVDGWQARLTSGLERAADPAAAGPVEPTLNLGGDPTRDPDPLDPGEGRARPRPPQVFRKPSETRCVLAARDGERIFIHDGVTYVALIPLSVNPMPRLHEVEIVADPPFMVVHAYSYYGGDPLDFDRFYGADAPPSSGFAMELGDATQFPSFDAFRQHVMAGQVRATWDAEAKLIRSVYASGDDVLEMDFDPRRYPAVRRSVNGRWPYLPGNVMRESAYAVQGAGRLEKNGAVLEGPAKHQLYLLAMPECDTYVAYNSLPTPVDWALTVPPGVRIAADGKVANLRVVVRPGTRELWIDHALRPGQATDGVATALRVSGLAAAPVVTLNDRPHPGPIAGDDRDGQRVFVVPLRPAGD